LTLAALEGAAGRGPEEVGGKAAGLARLVALGLPVPEARVLGADAHERWLAGGGLAAEDVAALRDAAAAMRPPLAVRSSATDEDRADRSAAGQYESVMGVEGADALLAAVEHCYRAADADRARAYRDGAGARVALVVQHEARADRAGVGFSADPVSGARGAVLVEAVFGHGEGIVGGQVTPDRYVVARDGGAVRARRADKAVMADGRGGLRDLADERRLARVLADDEARAVAGAIVRAETGFARPVDVEFCFEGTELWVVQCRPITTLP
jgi:phosphoenolpyruvate synthase/pyruvate phosphate dikinase